MNDSVDPRILMACVAGLMDMPTPAVVPRLTTHPAATVRALGMTSPNRHGNASMPEQIDP